MQALIADGSVLVCCLANYKSNLVYLECFQKCIVIRNVLYCSVAHRNAVSVRTLALPEPAYASAVMLECVVPTSTSPVHRGRDSFLRLQQRRYWNELAILFGYVIIFCIVGLFFF